jgi:hypothetical protein
MPFPKVSGNWMKRGWVVYCVTNSFPIQTMICNCVIWNCSLVGVFSCAVDADLVAKGLYGSIVVQCRLDDYTDMGKEIVRNPA